jgi:hypothetical protein
VWFDELTLAWSAVTLGGSAPVSGLSWRFSFGSSAWFTNMEDAKLVDVPMRLDSRFLARFQLDPPNGSTLAR